VQGAVGALSGSDGQDRTYEIANLQFTLVSGMRSGRQSRSYMVDRYQTLWWLMMAGSNDIVERLEAAADTVPDDLPALLIEAADKIRDLRVLLTVDEQTWLEGVKPEGNG
jgi:hypothetical protein